MDKVLTFTILKEKRINPATQENENIYARKSYICDEEHFQYMYQLALLESVDGKIDVEDMEEEAVATVLSTR